MHPPWFFGYGSLVNRATHTYPEAQVATLAGHRRVWRATSLRKVAFLSIEPCAETTIQGLIAQVPGADWAALDEREAAYNRRVVTHQVAAKGTAPEVWAYAVESPHPETPKDDHPILQSYLDTVLMGFMAEFGPSGVTHFMETTSGWDHPIHDDRAEPVYARAQRITDAERGLIDAALKQR